MWLCHCLCHCCHAPLLCDSVTVTVILVTDRGVQDMEKIEQLYQQSTAAPGTAAAAALAETLNSAANAGAEAEAAVVCVMFALVVELSWVDLSMYA